MLELGCLLLQRLAASFQLVDQLLGVASALPALALSASISGSKGSERCLSVAAQFVHDFVRVRPGLERLDLLSPFLQLRFDFIPNSSMCS